MCPCSIPLEPACPVPHQALSLFGPRTQQLRLLESRRKMKGQEDRETKEVDREEGNLRNHLRTWEPVRTGRGAAKGPTEPLGRVGCLCQPRPGSPGAHLSKASLTGSQPPRTPGCSLQGGGPEMQALRGLQAQALTNGSWPKAQPWLSSGVVRCQGGQEEAESTGKSHRDVPAALTRLSGVASAPSEEPTEGGGK